MQVLNKGINKNEANLAWLILDPQRRGFVELSEIHQVLCSRFGKDKASQKEQTSIFEKAVAKIVERSGGGFKGLQRCLKVMDNNGDKKLSKEELQ